MRVLLPAFIIFLLVGAVFFIVVSQPSLSAPVVPAVSTTSQPASVAQIHVPTPASTPQITGTTSPVATTKIATTTPKKPISKPKNEPVKSAVPPPSQVERTQLPYSTLPESFESIDTAARAALINILCMPQGGTLRPISGSGVIIDPRGIVLTNAHVAQYVLLSESPQINLTCTLRTGSPAYPRWKASVLYIPPMWVSEHYSEINADHVVGTGEHDYAFLLITADAQGNPVSGALPFLPIDSRENVAFEGDPILGAGYPAEFVGGIVAQQGLYAVTSISTIKKLLTFNTTTVDVFSVGGVIEAQGGSSGGPVVNAWRYVVGIITTTSEGASTAQRDLHALSLNYIDRDIKTQTGETLQNILAGNVTENVLTFSQQVAPALIQKYVDYLSK